MLGRPLRIGHELGAETLVIGDRLLGESARLELALAKQYRDLGYRKGECIGHRYLLLSDIPHMTEGQRGEIAVWPLSRKRTLTIYVAYWQCAPKARITSGGRFHPESCRLI